MNDNYEQTDYSLEVEGQTQLRCCDVEKSFLRIIRRFDSHHNAFTLILIINSDTEGWLFLKLVGVQLEKSVGWVEVDLDLLVGTGVATSTH